MAHASAEPPGGGSQSARVSQRLLDRLSEFKGVTLISHVHPDPDSLGSMMGLAHLISKKLRIPTTLAASPPGQLTFTSDSNQLTTIQQYNIVGMTLATDATNADATAITSVEKTHGGMRMPVWLNYPYVNATQRGASDA